MWDKLEENIEVMPVPEQGRFIWWSVREEWQIAQVLTSTQGNIYLHLWQKDGKYLGLTPPVSKEKIVKNPGYRRWLFEGRPDLRVFLKNNMGQDKEK